MLFLLNSVEKLKYLIHMVRGTTPLNNPLTPSFAKISGKTCRKLGTFPFPFSSIILVLHTSRGVVRLAAIAPATLFKFANDWIKMPKNDAKRKWKRRCFDFDPQENKHFHWPRACDPHPTTWSAQIPSPTFPIKASPQIKALERIHGAAGIITANAVGSEELGTRRSPVVSKLIVCVWDGIVCFTFRT